MLVLATGELGCLYTAAPAEVTLSGVAAPYCDTFANSGLGDGQAASLLLTIDGANCAIFVDAVYDATGGTFSLPAAAKTIGTLGASATVRVLAVLDGIDSGDIGDSTAAGRSLLTGADAAAQRASLGLGGAALLEVGTVAGTVAAGDDSRFSAVGAIGSGVDFFPTDTAIVPAGTNSTYPIKTLAKAPSGLAEDVDAITIPGSSTAMYGAYLYNTPLTGDQLDGGIWEFNVYGGVDSATGVTTLTQNVYRVRPEAVVTATTTGTGTSRTCTASGGTPFATGVIDASASLLDCSFVQTPQGLYPITARTSDTVVTITTPTTYVNEAGVALSVHKKLFGVTSGEINNVAGTAPAWTGVVLLPQMLSVQADIPLVAGDRIATTFLGTTTSATARTLYFAHDGTARYSHFHTPLELQHNDLEGLQGGTTGQMYHLTAAQASALHAAVTLAGTPDYLTITGQEITRGAIDLATDVTGALPVLNGGTGGTSLPKLDDLSAPDDNTDLNASTSAHGLLLKATAPASGLMSVVGIANGETVYANKSLFDATNPAALGTAAPGSAMAAARRDHVHTLPKIDDLAAADDNTDLDATVSAHGLLPKLGGGTTNFLRADGTWAAAGGGAPGGADTQVQFNDSSAFGGDAGLTFNKTTKALTVGGATVTTSVPVLNLSQTWNAGAVAFTGLKFNVTDTASSVTSLLADFQVGGTSSKLKLRKDGKLTFSTNAALLPSGTGVIFYDNSDSDAFYIQAYNTGVSITSLGSYRFSSTTSPTGTADLMLYRGAANTLHQRNSTNAQTYWLEETYTGASDYSRLSINAQAGGAFQIKALAAGSGTKRGIQIGAAAADTIAFLGATPAAQRTHVADPSGGSTVDAEARTAINAILVTLETFGFHATS